MDKYSFVINLLVNKWTGALCFIMIIGLIINSSNDQIEKSHQEELAKQKHELQMAETRRFIDSIGQNPLDAAGVESFEDLDKLEGKGYSKAQIEELRKLFIERMRSFNPNFDKTMDSVLLNSDGMKTIKKLLDLAEYFPDTISVEYIEYAKSLLKDLNSLKNKIPTYGLSAEAEKVLVRKHERAISILQKKIKQSI